MRNAALGSNERTKPGPPTPTLKKAGKSQSSPPLIFSILLVLSLPFLTSFCAQSDTKPPSEMVPPDSDEIRPFVQNIVGISEYSLVWQDEFEGTMVDTSKWNIENTDGCPHLCGFGNNELQFYSQRSENVYIENGSLVIKAQRETPSGPFSYRDYTSGKLTTKTKADWLYGIFEVRAKLPTTQGLWPAIWMLPTQNTYGGWPYSGEIDIMEVLGKDDRYLYGTLHYFDRQMSSRGSVGNTHKLTMSEPGFSQDFYVFTVVWTPDIMNWYVNDKFYHSVRKERIKGGGRDGSALPGFGPFDHPFHMILNTAVGGNWPGNPDETTILPQNMHIDYVRVFQKPSESDGS